jgi:heme exporter protein C
VKTMESGLVTGPTRTTGTRATRVVGLLALFGVAWLIAFGLLIANPDVNQRDAVRILFVHVPAAEMAYVAFSVTAVCSIGFLWKRTRSLAWDRVAGASAELGVVFTGLTLLTGSLWGKITWGTYWVWDARLTSTALLFIMFVGYLAVRRLEGSPEQRARRSSIVALFAVLDVPIVHFSVQWWRTLHQGASLTTKGALNGTFRFAHLVGIVTMMLAYVWLMMHRNRVLMLEDIVEGHSFETAIEERRAEGRDGGYEMVGS